MTDIICVKLVIMLYNVSNYSSTVCLGTPLTGFPPRCFLWDCPLPHLLLYLVKAMPPQCGHLCHQGVFGSNIMASKVELLEFDKEALLSPTGWLTDSIVNAVQRLIKKQFPDIKGFQDTCLWIGARVQHCARRIYSNSLFTRPLANSVHCGFNSSSCSCVWQQIQHCDNCCWYTTFFNYLYEPEKHSASIHGHSTTGNYKEHFILFITSCINFPHISMIEWQQWLWTICNC